MYAVYEGMFLVKCSEISYLVLFGNTPGGDSLVYVICFLVIKHK